MTPAALFDAALLRVESVSIRSWAEAQREPWLKLAGFWLAQHGAKHSEPEAVIRFATYIMCQAIGL